MSASDQRLAPRTAQTTEPPPLYTPEQRQRRDATPWTLVQGVLAPAQFLVFLVSLILVLRALTTGHGMLAASISVVVKTLFLYAIMVTGAIWEKRVFDCYLFAPAFYWEDVFSMLVIALHTAYLGALFTGWLDARGQLLLALAAFATYVVNATQFILKLRAARLGEKRRLEASAMFEGATQ
jgi:3-vinyl bacteriochlorophyllide hydratase